MAVAVMRIAGQAAEGVALAVVVVVLVRMVVMAVACVPWPE